MLALRRSSCVLLLVLLLPAIICIAQTAGGIKGVVTDESGAVVPAAAINLSGKGVQKAVQSQADGTYSFVGLPPGQYTIRTTVPGFSPFTQQVTVANGVVNLPISLNVTA